MNIEFVNNKMNIPTLRAQIVAKRNKVTFIHSIPFQRCLIDEGVNAHLVEDFRNVDLTGIKHVFCVVSRKSFTTQDVNEFLSLCDKKSNIYFYVDTDSLDEYPWIVEKYPEMVI